MQLDSYGRHVVCLLLPGECRCGTAAASSPPATTSPQPHQPRQVAPQQPRKPVVSQRSVEDRIRSFIERHGNGGEVSLRSLKRATGATEDDIQALVRRGELALRQDRRKGLGKTWVRSVARVSSWQ